MIGWFDVFDGVDASLPTALTMNGLRKSLSSMETPAIHNMMCAAIQLVQHYSILHIEKQTEDQLRRARNVPVRRNRHWLEDVLQTLDENSRELRLFDCLAVPDDRVRL